MRGWSLLFIVFVTLVVVLCNGCMASPNAGYEAVLIEKPLIFGHGGVDPEPVSTGSTFIALTTDVEYVSMQPNSSRLRHEGHHV